jgi:hypothetical protein
LLYGDIHLRRRQSLATNIGKIKLNFDPASRGAEL